MNVCEDLEQPPIRAGITHWSFFCIGQSHCSGRRLVYWNVIGPRTASSLNDTGVGLCVILNRGGSLQCADGLARSSVQCALCASKAPAHGARLRTGSTCAHSPRSFSPPAHSSVSRNGCHPHVQHLPGAPNSARHRILLRAPVSGGVLAAGNSGVLPTDSSVFPNRAVRNVLKLSLSTLMCGRRVCVAVQPSV